MDITRIQKLAGIIAESADVTKKIAAGKIDTKDKAEAISNQIVQGENGDIQVSDEAKPEEKPTVPKDVPKKKAVGLKEAFGQVMAAQAPMTSSMFRQPPPAPQGQAQAQAQAGRSASPMDDVYAAYKAWKAEVLKKDPKATFTGTKEGTEATNWTSARPRAVGKFIKAKQEGIVY